MAGGHGAFRQNPIERPQPRGARARKVGQEDAPCVVHDLAIVVGQALGDHEIEDFVGVIVAVLLHLGPPGFVPVLVVGTIHGTFQRVLKGDNSLLANLPVRIVQRVPHDCNHCRDIILEDILEVVGRDTPGPPVPIGEPALDQKPLNVLRGLKRRRERWLQRRVAEQGANGAGFRISVRRVHPVLHPIVDDALLLLRRCRLGYNRCPCARW